MPQAILLKKANLHPLSLLDRLTKDFLQEEYIFSEQFGLDILLKRMETLSQSSAGVKPVFTVYPGGDCSFINTLKDQSPLLQTGEQNLNLIKEAIFKSVLGLTPEEQAQQCSYTDDLSGALKATDEGIYELCVIVI